MEERRRVLTDGYPMFEWRPGVPIIDIPVLPENENVEDNEQMPFDNDIEEVRSDISEQGNNEMDPFITNTPEDRQLN